MKYICLSYLGPINWETMSESQRKASMEEFFAYDAQLRKNGNLIGGEGLESAAGAVTLRFQEGKISVTDGPYAETKEQMAGLFVLEARDLNHAIQLMAKHPVVKGGAVEIRAVADPTMMKREREKVLQASSDNSRPSGPVLRKLTVNLNLTLDGVMQAPGRADEDTRGGFGQGGWAGPYFDPVMAGNASRGMAEAPALLFGRRTYEDFYSVWPNRTDNPFTTFLNNARKYVVSTTLKEPLVWTNSTLLSGEAAATVAALKQQPGSNLLVIGSGELIQTLGRHNLIDDYVLSIHPLVLGNGRRLFPEGCPPHRFKLVETKITSTDVIIATYRPAAPNT